MRKVNETRTVYRYQDMGGPYWQNVYGLFDQKGKVKSLFLETIDGNIVTKKKFNGDTLPKGVLWQYPYRKTKFSMDNALRIEA